LQEYEFRLVEWIDPIINPILDERKDLYIKYEECKKIKEEK
jgi:hypothetical protein